MTNLGKPKAARQRLLSLRAALLLLGAGALAANCSQSDTVLLVHVTASAAPVDGIQQLHTTIRVGGQTRVIDVPDAPAAIALPTSFTVQLARSFSGDLSVHVDARDAASTIIASGTQTVSPLQVGQQNEITIDLAPGAAPDAGMDGLPDTTGTGGVMGTGGATGSGGAVGSGGVAAGTGGATAGTSGATGGATATGGAAGGSAGSGARGGGGGHAGTVGTGGHAGAPGSGGRPATGGTVGSGGVASGGVMGSGGVTASGGVPGSGGAATGGSNAGGGGAAGTSGDMGGAAGS